MNAVEVVTTGRVAVITLDVPGERVNTLSMAVATELLAAIDGAGADSRVDAIVLVSGKADGFIAGADVKELAAMQTNPADRPSPGLRRSAEAAARAEAGGDQNGGAWRFRDLAAEGQRMMNRVAALPKPLVVGIHGACLGGGLELALAARYRIASDAASTKLGLPEVQLGLIPGAGGCQRLPRLVGLRAALDMILAGRSLSAGRARGIGLVHEVVPAAIVRDVAVKAAARLAEGWRPPVRRSTGALSRLLDRNPLGRAVVFAQAGRTVRARTGGHYPAPAAALAANRTGLRHGMADGLAREAELFGALAAGDVSRHLVGLFLATNALKKDPGVPLDAELARRVDRLGIVGAGFMGASIAGLAALQAGSDVRLRDTDPQRVARGVRTARGVLDEALTRRRLDRTEHYRRVALLSGTTDDSGFASRDLVIEAVFEDLGVKRTVIADLERATNAGCVIASNTSTLPIARLQEGAVRPQRIVGMHFFSPVERMPLLEVIRGPETTDATAATAVRFGQRLGKTVILVRDAPGFWVNRILAPYLNEAGWLLDEGVSIERIDRAMTRFGFPVGPMALLDEVGLDVAGKASQVLHEALGDRLAPAPAVARLLAAGRLGRKSSRGFYTYRDGRRRRVDRAVYDVAGVKGRSGLDERPIQRRLLLALLNEAARALSEGVVASARDGDVGAVFGFGFPPFLGGPLRHIDDLGAGAVAAELERLAAALGPRFAPAEALRAAGPGLDT
jgi:3-hydroxyacyl-CoA dehydrogenase/enoyl-CoA hydratase/3-hydroxybutyryl-CoA epimerase